MRLYTVQCTVKFIWLADFVFILYVAQSRQSARLFLQSSELAPQPQESVSPFLWFEGGTHLPACEGVTLQSWCDCVKWPYGVKKISMKWLWPVKVTLKVIKRHLKVFCWSCDGVPLQWNKKKIPSLQFVIMDQISLLSPLSSNDRSIPLSKQTFSTLSKEIKIISFNFLQCIA